MNVHVIEHGPSYIVIGWEKPRDTNKIEKYEVKFFQTGKSSNGTTIETATKNYAFRNLKTLAKFGFQV